MKAILHGENFLNPIKELPAGFRAKAQIEKGNSIIIGHSETGHNHVVECEQDLEYLVDEIERYLIVKATSKIVHQKNFDVHETLTVEPGIYKITTKQEYNPFEGVMQRVYD